jgi:mono/diheme cytochrome c family protein
LFISDDVHGRIWRVTYQGGNPAAAIAAAAVSPARATASRDAKPPEGIHPDAGKDAAALPVPQGFTKEQVALGNRVFHGEVADGTCGGCHGSDAKGSPIAPDLTSGKWLWSDGSVQGLETTIKNGVPEPKAHPGAMPPMGGVDLSKADLDAVSAYVWALGHRTQ